MSNLIKILPSILSSNFLQLKEEIKEVEKAGADLIHIDVMDGHFVPTISFGPLLIKAIRSISQIPLDVHLMIENPDFYIKDFVEVGADYIGVHVETCIHLNRTINNIINFGKKPIIALNPHTPLSSIEHVLELVSAVLIMGVNPGFSGQSFISNTKRKVEALHQMIVDRGLSIPIEVDGGVSLETIGSLARVGAEFFVSGSAIFGCPGDYKRVIEKMRKNARDFLKE